MELPPQDAPPSKNIVDRRAVAKKAGWLAALLTAFGVGRVTGTPADPDRDLVTLTSAALDRAQDHWRRVLGARWRDARVVLIDSPLGTPCGLASKDSGPFYCPADERIYLDLSFLRAIDGDLARAYVIAHELGHHVQKIVGDGRRAAPAGEPVAVAVELEADCYAGSWIAEEVERRHVVDVDVAAALTEASAVGDDRICPQCSREEWSHGDADDRVASVLRGMRGETCAN